MLKVEGNDAVLGAGALGLTAAHRLSQRGRRVVVLEREPLPGGLASGFQPVPGSWLERFYHHIFRSDRRAIALIEELGLGPRLTWHRPVTATWRDDRAWPLDSPSSLLRFGPLPVPDRVRMGAVLAFLRLLPDPRPLEGRAAAPWIRRWMGSRGHDVVWGPLLQAKFGPLADEIALPWFWARVHDRTADLGYLGGGFQQLYEALAGRIRAAGSEIRLSTTVLSVEPDGAGWCIEASGPEGPVEVRAERVISTLPTRLTARLVPALPEAWRTRHDVGRAYGAHALILALDRRLTGAYWLNLNDPGFPFTALVEHTNLRSPDEYGGHHLVYLGTYRPMDDPLMTASPDEALEAAVPHLRRLRPAFDRSWVRERWAFTAPFAQPIVDTAYRRAIPPFRTPLAGLWIANMFQVYPHDRGQNYSIALAERLVAALERPVRRT